MDIAARTQVPWLRPWTYRPQVREAPPVPEPPWPRCTARSVSDLFALAEPCLHLPRYPRYAPGEERVGDFDYFYLRSDRYLSCQAARFLLFGGAFLTLADEAAVNLGADVSPYWSGFFREHFPEQIGEVLRFFGPTGFRAVVARHPRLKVVSPHPFDSAYIPAERYYLNDPSLTVRLNDKGRLHELTSRVPRHQTLTSAAFARGLWREHWPLPFVVKLTEPSGGGDGVMLCRREQDLNKARHRFAGRPVKVEQYLEDFRGNFNVQLQIAPDRRISYVGGSEQRVDQGRYSGNCIDLQWLPPLRVATLCDEVARTAAALGWHGVCGLDLIEDGAGEVWLIDPNFRLNGSTPFFLLGDYLSARLRRPQLTTGYFCYPGAPAELLERFRREIHRRALVPVGVHYDPREDATTRIYGALVSDGDPEANEGLRRAFAARGLRSGIEP